MKAVKSKAEERTEIERQIELFLQHGGKVKSVEPGVSGRELGAHKLPPISFAEPKVSRTPLIEEVRAIEARRRSRLSPAPSKRKGPRRILITDDFGEPLRWSWQES